MLQQLWSRHDLSNWASSLQVIDIHMKDKYYSEEVEYSQAFNLKISTVWAWKIYATPYINAILLLLNYMQSLGDVIVSLEFNRSSTHTLWIEGSLSLELIYYSYFAWLGLWYEGGRILTNLIKELKLCCMIVCVKC